MNKMGHYSSAVLILPFLFNLIAEIQIHFKVNAPSCCSFNLKASDIKINKQTQFLRFYFIFFFIKSIDKFPLFFLVDFKFVLLLIQTRKGFFYTLHCDDCEALDSRIEAERRRLASSRFTLDSFLRWANNFAYSACCSLERC